MAKEPFAAKLTTVWLGALFFWMLKGFKGKLSEEVSNHETRNMWMGYMLSLLVVLLLLYYFLI